MSDEKEQQFNVHVVPMVGTEQPLAEGGRPEGLPKGEAYVERIAIRWFCTIRSLRQ